VPVVLGIGHTRNSVGIGVSNTPPLRCHWAFVGLPWFVVSG